MTNIDTQFGLTQIKIVWIELSIQLNWPPRYNWIIVESGVKHHNTHSIMV
jgi:hypothetical protein